MWLGWKYMTVKKRVYLAGKCDTKETWQDDVKSFFLNQNCIFFDPRNLEQNLKTITIHEIVDQEVRWLNKSDVLFVYLQPIEKHSPLGTIVELMHLLHKDIDIIVVDEKNDRASSWLHNYLMAINKKSHLYYVHSIQDGVDVLKSVVFPRSYKKVKQPVYTTI